MDKLELPNNNNIQSLWVVMVLYRHVKYQDSLKSIDHVLREKRKGPFSDLLWSLPYFFRKQEISTKTNIQYFWKYIYFLYFFFLLLLSLVLYFHVINLMYKFGEIGKSSFLGNKGFPRVLQCFTFSTLKHWAKFQIKLLDVLWEKGVIDTSPVRWKDRRTGRQTEVCSSIKPFTIRVHLLGLIAMISIIAKKNWICSI